MANCLRLMSILILIIFEGQALAAVMSRDYRSQGDGLLTYDAENHREWLDLDETQLMEISDVQAQLLPSGNLQGFRIAVLEEVEQLWTSAGIDRSDSFDSAYGEPALRLIDLLGPTRVIDGTFIFRFSRGYIADTDSLGLPLSAGVYAYWLGASAFGLNDYPPAWRGIVTTERFGFANTTSGFWLYREAPVPEPGTESLFLTVVATIWTYTRRHRRS